MQEFIYGLTLVLACGGSKQRRKGGGGLTRESKYKNLRNWCFCCQLQVKCLCVLLFLSFPLTMTEVPGPCRHSITREHLLTVRHLVGAAGII